MTIVILLVLGIVGATGVAVALALRKVASPKAAHPVTAEWIEELSTEPYRPMLRLLDPADPEFLRSHPDFDRGRMTQFRRQRSRIFRAYLDRLNTDFACVCLALKVVMLQSEIDRPDLASKLFRHQLRFAAGMIAAHVRLALYDLGIGAVEVQNLLSLFDAMRFELQQMVPESAVWGS